MNLEIVYLSPHDLTPYENNTRKHNPEDIDGIKKSIQDCGFRDPIGIWGKNNLIVEGHGRQIAAIELGLETVPCIRLDDMTEDQRKEYAIRHNRSAELSAWDFGKLEEELADLQIRGIDLSDLKFDIGEEVKQDVDRYTKATKIPQYEPSEEGTEISELVSTLKVEALISEIEASSVSQEEKDFLKVAAYRHAVIDFDKVADYYATATAEMQWLMERSALVLIDYQDAIANGYAACVSALDEAMVDDDAE